MCYSSPGPRCSAHARADLKNAQLAEAATLALLDAANDVEDRITNRLGGGHRNGLSDTPPPVEGSLADDKQRRDDYSRLVDDYWRAKDALARAREVYESTPEGIAGLKDELVARQQELDGAVENDRTYQDLAYRLHIGQDSRARQMAAYKAKHGSNAPAPEGDLEDEDEAAAPPPPCTCIEYRYQSTCVHVANKVAHIRRRLLPTSDEAALDAHTAAATFHLRQNEARTIAATPRARTAAVRGLEPLPEQVEADNAVAEAWSAMQHAQQTFFTTPAGQAFLEAKMQTANTRPAYLPDDTNPTGFRTATLDEAYVAAQRLRVANEAEYHSLLATDAYALTGETEEEVTQRIEDSNKETHTPPDLLYANPCPHRCPDFQWLGDCPHLGEPATSVTPNHPNAHNNSGAGDNSGSGGSGAGDNSGGLLNTIAAPAAAAAAAALVTPAITVGTTPGNPTNDLTDGSSNTGKKSIVHRIFGI